MSLVKRSKKGKAAPAGLAPCILIVEDDIDIREALADVLGDAGYDVAQAGNGAEALTHLSHAKVLPRLILLDLMMPIMDGYQFRLEQEKVPKLALIPVVVLSAARNGEELAAPIRPASFLGKPVDLKQLLKIVGPLCRP